MSEKDDIFKDLFECRCKPKYTIEKHGNGYAIYWGRCMHRHGAKIAMLTEIHRDDLIQYFEDSLNANINRRIKP